MLLRRPLLHTVRVADIVLFYPALAIVVWGELTGPQSEALNLLSGIWDKALHFFAYFMLSAMAAAALKARHKVYFTSIALILLGGVLEILQGFSGREVSFDDQLANICGVILGGIGSRVLVEHLRRVATP